jgi:hypothetical protein
MRSEECLNSGCRGAPGTWAIPSTGPKINSGSRGGGGRSWSPELKVGGYDDDDGASVEVVRFNKAEHFRGAG